VEGITDLLAITALLADADEATRLSTIVWTNSDGARSTNVSSWWLAMLSKILPQYHAIIHDRDEAGEQGATKWAAVLRRSAPTKVVMLDLSYTTKKGQDLRVYILSSNGDSAQKWLMLNSVIGSAQVQSVDDTSNEASPTTTAITVGSSVLPPGKGGSPPSIESVMTKHSVSPRITNAELRRSTEQNEYIIDGVLVRGQPCVIAGPSKAMKTTIGIDLAVSLASVCPEIDPMANFASF